MVYLFQLVFAFSHLSKNKEISPMEFQIWMPTEREAEEEMIIWFIHESADAMYSAHAHA